MQRRAAAVWAGMAIASGVAPAAAGADEVIEAQTMWRYGASTYTIDQGEKLDFLNADALSPGPHDVTSETNGPDGQPLFASETIPHGQTVPVKGAQQLKTGSYGFHCTVHPFMTATLEVTDKGTPAGPPSSPPPPPSSPPPARDTTAPSVDASLSPAKLRRALRQRRFTAFVTANEPARLAFTLSARVGGRTFAVGRASGFYATAGERTAYRVAIGRAAARRLAKTRRVVLTLAVSATDGSGNVGRKTVRRTLKR